MKQMLWFMAFLMMGLVLLWERNSLQQMGYEIQALEEKQKKMRQVNHQLLIEISSLSSFRRVEKIATTRLGMIRPGPHQVVMVVNGADGKTPLQEVNEPIRLAKELRYP